MAGIFSNKKLEAARAAAEAEASAATAVGAATAPNGSYDGGASYATAAPVAPAAAPGDNVRQSLSGKYVCPFCGSVNENEQGTCPRCTMENTAASRKATKVRIGPWYVLQTRNPAAPGMKFETLLSFVKKGRVKPTSIVRGPTTHQLWRFAAQVKGLSREFGVCYSCGASIDRTAGICPQCNRAQDPPPNPDVLLESGKEGAATPAATATAPARRATARGERRRARWGHRSTSARAVAREWRGGIRHPRDRRRLCRRPDEPERLDGRVQHERFARRHGDRPAVGRGSTPTAPPTARPETAAAPRDARRPRRGNPCPPVPVLPPTTRRPATRPRRRPPARAHPTATPNRPTANRPAPARAARHRLQPAAPASPPTAAGRNRSEPKASSAPATSLRRSSCNWPTTETTMPRPRRRSPPRDRPTPPRPRRTSAPPTRTRCSTRPASAARAAASGRSSSCCS